MPQGNREKGVEVVDFCRSLCDIGALSHSRVSADLGILHSGMWHVDAIVAFATFLYVKHIKTN